ncbi:hypothetical protein Q5752_002871 [Cryptotrichosporon argae]
MTTPPPPPLLPSHSRDAVPALPSLPSTPRSTHVLRSAQSPHVTQNRDRSSSSPTLGGVDNKYGEKLEIEQADMDKVARPRKVNVKAATIKYLYTNLNFPYPVFITSFHLGCAALGTRILRATTHLMDGLDNIPMTPTLYAKSIIPIGVLFSGSLILSNTAYLTLSVSFIQMLKAFTPVAIILTSSIFGIQTLSAKLVGIVFLISGGCALAAYGELHFEMFGFLCQAAAVGFESSRLVMIELLLKGMKMDPLCSLHYYAPVCAIINACFIPFTEGMAPFRELARIGPLVLSTNAACAFGLNVAAVFLIGAAGGLVLTLAGVFKDILLISASVIFLGSSITPIQVFGYSLALSGLMAYRNVSKK